jgi:hypothetical protein
MPILVAIIVVSFVTGLLAKPVTARSVAVVLALLANAVFVWAIADGKGDDPAWIIALSVVGGALAVGAAHVAGRMRHATA